MNAAIEIVRRAAEIRQESAPGAVLVPFEETTTAQKVWPIGRAWAEYHGWRPPARVIETVEDMAALPDGSVIRTVHDFVMDKDAASDPYGDTPWLFGSRRYANLATHLPATVLFDGGSA